MKYVEQAIRDAVKSGWMGIDLPSEGSFHWSENRYGKNYDYAVNCAAFLDPVFWQALGRARGWKDLESMCLHQNSLMTAWRHHWHRFIDHLAEGKDAESFFAELY